MILTATVDGGDLLVCVCVWGEGMEWAVQSAGRAPKAAVCVWVGRQKGEQRVRKCAFKWRPEKNDAHMGRPKVTHIRG